MVKNIRDQFVRHVQSANHYARIRMRGKLIWKTPKTGRIRVARLCFNILHKEARQCVATHTALARGS